MFAANSVGTAPPGGHSGCRNISGMLPIPTIRFESMDRESYRPGKDAATEGRRDHGGRGMSEPGGFCRLPHSLKVAPITRI
ncbi:MAG TPA: hypothetical protein PLQ35_17860, partial [bacterium]|nr:hypothetical protein [bacterium]